MNQQPEDAPGQPEDAPGQPQAGSLVVNINRFGPVRRSKVNVMVDGVRMVNNEGANVFWLAPGRHMLSCEVNAAGRTYGQADMAVELAAGQATEVFYTGPAGVNTAGVLGYQPVRHPGARARMACLLSALVLCLGTLAAVLAIVISLTRR